MLSLGIYQYLTFSYVHLLPSSTHYNLSTLEADSFIHQCPSARYSLGMEQESNKYLVANRSYSSTSKIFIPVK